MFKNITFILVFLSAITAFPQGVQWSISEKFSQAEINSTEKRLIEILKDKFCVGNINEYNILPIFSVDFILPFTKKSHFDNAEIYDCIKPRYMVFNSKIKKWKNESGKYLCICRAKISYNISSNNNRLIEFQEIKNIKDSAYSINYNSNVYNHIVKIVTPRFFNLTPSYFLYSDKIPKLFTKKRPINKEKAYLMPETYIIYRNDGVIVYQTDNSELVRKDKFITINDYGKRYDYKELVRLKKANNYKAFFILNIPGMTTGYINDYNAKIREHLCAIDKNNNIYILVKYLKANKEPQEQYIVYPIEGYLRERIWQKDSLQYINKSELIGGDYNFD
jgi:hypothetical protein